jgi:hypothetical protein
MKNLNEVIAALKAQMNEVENMFNNQKNQEVTFTKEELIEYTKTISQATVNGIIYELSKKDNFNFDSALYTKRNSSVMGGLEVKVSRGRVLSEVVKSIDWELNDGNIEDTIDTLLDSMDK